MATVPNKCSEGDPIAFDTEVHLIKRIVACKSCQTVGDSVLRPTPSPALRPEWSPTPRRRCTRAAPWGTSWRRTGSSSTRSPRTTRTLRCEVTDEHFEPSKVWRQWWSTGLGHEMQLDLNRQDRIRKSSSLFDHGRHWHLPKASSLHLVLFGRQFGHESRRQF